MWRDQPNILRSRHKGTAFFLPQSSSSGISEQGDSMPLAPRESSPPITTNKEFQQIQSNPLIETTDSTLDALLIRYRMENERLRDQIKAQALHKTLLEQRLHELSARNTALHLQEFRKKDNEPTVDILKKQLEERQKEVYALQLKVEEQAGRISTYEEAVSRPRCDTSEFINSSLSSALTTPLSSTHRTHELLCQALSSVGFLTRVFNAVDHCQAKLHEGVECPRPLQECTTHCLHAAMRGNQETSGEILARGYNISCEKLALAIREELLFCETAAVRTAARLLGEQSLHISAGEIIQNEVREVDPLEKEQQKQEDPDQEQKEQEQDDSPIPFLTQREKFEKKDEHEKEKCVSHKTRKPVVRPAVDDCQVQPKTSKEFSHMSSQFAFHDVSNDAIKNMSPSEALQKHLENAQLAHRVCVAKALKAEEPPVEKCALTWGEVLIRYQAWAEYRPPFQDSVAQAKYTKYWTKKRQVADDNNPFK